MTFADMLTTLETRGALTPSRVKDVKTSLRYLARALGYAGLDVAPVDETCKDPAHWTSTLESYFDTLEAGGQTISALTRRNSRNNLRVVFRAAETQGLLPTRLPSRLLQPPTRTEFERLRGATTPYPATYRGKTRHCYRLPLHQWSPAMIQGWQAYQAKCGLRIRESSFRTYQGQLESYFGYIANILGRTPVWEDLFVAVQVGSFVRWLAARAQRSLTAQGRHTANMIAAIAHVIEHPAHKELRALCATLKPPPATHIKRNHMISLALIDEVADAYLAEGRVPLVRSESSTCPGAKRAFRFQAGLILKLLVRVPLRQRNIREMQLGRNLTQDPTTGQWLLEFRGEELKVGVREGQANTYTVNLSEYAPEWVPLVQEWLTVHRHNLPNAATSPFVFLTMWGRPFSVTGLYHNLSTLVSMRTGKRFYPHLIRSIWATECLEQTKDFTLAATMLGDTIGVVMKTYYDVVNKDQHAKAKTFLSAALRRG
jgi:hypothetical protein